MSREKSLAKYSQKVEETYWRRTPKSQQAIEEWGQYNIRVNTIAPGLVKARFSKALWNNSLIRETAENDTILARVAEPEEMVGTTLFLASDASDYMTGKNF